MKYRRTVLAQLKAISLDIQKRRKEHGWSQEEFAEMVDLSALTIQFIEQGRRYPSLPILFYICNVLGISIKFER